MAPKDSNAIDVAIQATLMADAALMALVPDGVFFDDAAQGAQQFVIISLVTEMDDTIEVFGGRFAEDALYAIKAVTIGTSSATVAAAAALIDTDLEDQVLVNPGLSPAEVPGFACLTMHRETRIRYSEVDAIDPTIRWQHRGGHYRITMTLK